VVMKAMEREPANRFQGAGDVKAAVAGPALLPAAQLFLDTVTGEVLVTAGLALLVVAHWFLYIMLPQWKVVNETAKTIVLITGLVSLRQWMTRKDASPRLKRLGSRLWALWLCVPTVVIGLRMLAPGYEFTFWGGCFGMLLLSAWIPYLIQWLVGTYTQEKARAAPEK